MSSQKLSAKDREVYSKITTSDELYELQLDEKIWTSGPQRFAQVPEWARKGLVRPSSKAALDKTFDNRFTKKLSKFKFDKKEKKLKPFKNLTIYPSIDPYPPSLRALLRILMEENPWIIEGNEILQELTITESTRSLVPRTEEDLEDGKLDKWKQQKIFVPFFKKDVTYQELEKWLDHYFKKLDLDPLIFDAYLFAQEQGRTCIGMFPAERKANGRYPLPQAFRLIRPELLRRPIVDFDNGELIGVEVSNYTGNGSIMDANRCIYINLSKNLELFGDFYGRSAIRALADVGKVILQIYGIDWLQAAITTWHTSPIFKHTIPSKDWSTIKTLMDDFNSAMEGALNKVVSISNNVELLNPNGTDSGDITGLNDIEQRAFEVIAGRLGIPPYLFSRGKEGNMGGNANFEENEGFLRKIKRKQELYEKIIEDQCYDRVLAILFDVEPEDVSALPVKLLHNYEKPSLPLPLNTDEWNIMMFLVDNNVTSMEQVMERFGLRNMMLSSPTLGTDTSPTIKTFDPSAKTNHPTWDNRQNAKLQDRPLKKGFHTNPHESVNEITAQKKELISAIKNKVKGDTNHTKLKRKLENEHNSKIAKFDKEKIAWEAKREEEFLKNRK